MPKSKLDTSFPSSFDYNNHCTAQYFTHHHNIQTGTSSSHNRRRTHHYPLMNFQHKTFFRLFLFILLIYNKFDRFLSLKLSAQNVLRGVHSGKIIDTSQKIERRQSSYRSLFFHRCNLLTSQQ